jgi:hypothetical protein
VTNRLPYIAGRLRQTDAEVRKSYVDKIFARSNRMIESIRSAILLNVQGVKSVAGYQNDTNVVDADGRWPHCVEMVVEGGSPLEIALQIWDKKTDGIQTYGSGPPDGDGVKVEIQGDEGEPVTIRFSRPSPVYVWFGIIITRNPAEALPLNVEDAIRDIVISEMDRIDPGKPINPQRLIESRIYATVPGIAHIETKTFWTVDESQLPGLFAIGMVPISPRQRAVTDAARIRIEVPLG